MSLLIAVDSPPGMTRPTQSASCSGRRMATTSTPSDSSATTCSRKAPWSARTPIFTLPATLLHALGVRDVRDVDPDHGLAEVAGDPRDDVRVLEMRGRLDDRLGALGRIAGLEDAGADEHAVAAELHHERGVSRGRDAAGGEVDDRELPILGDPLDDLVGRLQVLGRGEELLAAQALQPGDLVGYRADVPHGLHDVAGTRLALGAHHRRALTDAAQRLAQVATPAHERDVEVPLVDVVLLVGRGQDLGLVDVVDAEGLQDLRLDEVADAALRHDGDRHAGHDGFDDRRVGHAGHAAGGADVGRDALEGPDGHRARVLGDLRLFDRDDVHDHAALEHLGEAGLDAQGRGGGAVAHSVLLHLAACGCSYFPLARVRFGWFSLPPARSANNPSRKCGKAARAPRGRRVRCCPDYFITMFWLFSMTWNQVTPGESLMVWPLAARNVGGPVSY